jgi:HK97 family phage major capsid protein
MKTKLTMKQCQEAIAEKSKLIGQILEEAGDEMDFSKVKCIEGADTQAKLDKLHAIESEITDLKKDYEEYQKISSARKLADEAANFEGQDLREQPGQKKETKKSIGEQFLEKGLNKKNAVGELDVELKTIVQTGAGWAPESLRLPRVELYPLRALRVADIFPAYTTGMSNIKYMEETTHTNNAAEIAEETDASSPTAYGEAAVAMTERSVPVEKVAVWIPVTQEQLEDVAGMADFVNNRLTYMVRNRLDGQLVAGNGSTPNIRGVLNASGIQTQAKGSDPTPDAIFKAMTKIRGVTAGTGFGEPSAMLIHPNDWQDIRLLRTADGIYIFGNPTESGPERMWGVPVVVTSAETEKTIVVGDFANYAALYIKRGLMVETSDSHGYLFTSGVLAIKATMRCAAVYFRGTAFCKVTGV